MLVIKQNKSKQKSDQQLIGLQESSILLAVSRQWIATLMHSIVIFETSV